MKKRTSYREFIMTEEQMKRLKDHLDINTSKDPKPISGTALIQGFDANGKEFTAKAKNCTLRLEQPSVEQLDMLTKDGYNKKFPYMGRIDVNLTEVMRQLFNRCPFGEIRLIYGEKIIATINTRLARYAERG